MKKVVNIEAAPGKFVPTLVTPESHPEHFVEEVVEVVEEVVEEKPKKRASRKKKED